jgi:hypothetical protein
VEFVCLFIGVRKLSQRDQGLGRGSGSQVRGKGRCTSEASSSAFTSSGGRGGQTDVDILYLV